MHLVDMACTLQRCQALLAGNTMWDLEGNYFCLLEGHQSGLHRAA